MIRRFLGVAYGLAALLALAPAQIAIAGNDSGAPVSAGEVNGVCAILPATIDSTAPADVLTGTRAWNFNLSTLAPVGQGLLSSITVNSGYPASHFIVEPEKGPFACRPGTQLSASGGLPFTTSATCDGGSCVNLNLGSDVAAQQTAGYYLTRSARPARIGPHGSQQTVAVDLDQALNCASVAIISNVPGAVVTSASATGSWNGNMSFGGPQASFDFGCNYSGRPVAFVVTFDVPNPFGHAFLSKPEVQLFNGASAFPTVSCSGYTAGTTLDPGPTGSETLGDSTLDGGTPGAGLATFTLTGYNGSWNRSQGCATFVDYQPAPLPSPNDDGEDD